MVGDFKDWTLVRTPSAATAGQISPQEQRDAFIRDQARASAIPPGEKAPPQTATRQPVTQQPQRPVSQSQQFPTGISQRPDAGKPGTQQPPPKPADSHDNEQALQKGRDASRGLAQIAQGGTAIKNPVLQSTLTPQIVMRNALIANFVPKSTQQTPGKTQTPTSPTRTGDQPATDKAVASKTKTDAKGVRQDDMGENSSRAQVVAGKQPPFAATPVRRESNSAKITTDGPTARAMHHVVTGRGVTAIATAQEFSAGGQGGFGDPDGDSAGLAKKTSPVALPSVYGEDDHVETVALCNHIAWTGVVGGGESPERRIQASIGDRILNTQDDTPLGSRILGSSRDHSQIAVGSRGSVIGKDAILA